jgi:multiple antibiotic resistance protein
LNDFINSILLVFAGLFPIVNPVGDAPIFLTLTRHCSMGERHTLASKVAVNSFILLTFSLFLGSYVLEFFGITLPVLRIAGGLVVTAFGWKLLHAGDTPDGKDDQGTAGNQVDAFYPLTMPLTVGPGSISVAIALGSQRPPAGQEVLTALATLALAAVLGVAAIALSIYICYRFAETIVSVLGPRGTDVVMRLSAFILLCIGIQIMWAGYSSLVHPAP